MSTPLIGADDHIRAANFLPEHSNPFLKIIHPHPATVRLFFLDYFAQNGNHGGRISYKLTGSAQNPKDACQNRFVAWERKEALFKKGTAQLR